MSVINVNMDKETFKILISKDFWKQAPQMRGFVLNCKGMKPSGACLWIAAVGRAVMSFVKVRTGQTTAKLNGEDR